MSTLKDIVELAKEARAKFYALDKEGKRELLNFAFEVTNSIKFWIELKEENNERNDVNKALSNWNSKESYYG